MKFAVLQNGNDPLRDRIVGELVQSFCMRGHEISSPSNGVKFVINLTDTESPRGFHRKSQSIFVISVVTAENTEKLRSVCYRTMVRSISNLLVCITPSDHSGSENPEIYFTTPEAGFYHIPFDPQKVMERILPLAGAHYAIQNRLTTDLPAPFWETSPVVEKIKQYGKELDDLGLLPAPFPLQELLSEDDIQYLYRVFEVKGLSYGNLSAREPIPDLGNSTFWMTGRGVNKAQITKPGRDVLLVKGFDYENGTALVSVPPDHDPRARVSVDAVEHELIYRTFPGVGAIVHVHAWMDGIFFTRQNFPCGTKELAEDVVSMLKQAGDPSRAVVGLKNHGLTITGHCLDEIFNRVRGNLITQVPMMA
jgi:ribulose-5-phosphate 4-epimerase/fuculose-1-phosphate aldolase